VRRSTHLLLRNPGMTHRTRAAAPLRAGVGAPHGMRLGGGVRQGQGACVLKGSAHACVMGLGGTHLTYLLHQQHRYLHWVHGGRGYAPPPAAPPPRTLRATPGPPGSPSLGPSVAAVHARASPELPQQGLRQQGQRHEQRQRRLPTAEVPGRWWVGRRRRAARRPWVPPLGSLDAPARCGSRTCNAPEQLRPCEPKL
jgi:hypothetical protein